MKIISVRTVRLLGAYLLGALLLGGGWLGTKALGGDVYFSLRDFIVTSQPLVRRTVEIQPNSTPLQQGTNIVLSERRYYNSGTNGEFTVTNMVAGDYRCLLYGPTQTNVFWLSVPTFTGTTNASYLLIANGANAQRVVTTIKTNGTAITTSARSIDFISGTNVVLRGTNASGFVTLEINSAGSAGGAATNAVSTVYTNAATVASGATGLRFVTGSNTLVLATNTAGLVSVQINATASAVGSTNVYTNVTFVNAVGTRYQAATSLTNAIQSAPAGTLIVVGPGTYELRTNETVLTMKNGVDQYWMPGSKFIVGISNTVQNMFDDSFGALTSSIYGYGEFYLTNASGGGSILYLDQNGSQVYFESQTAKTWSPGGDVINAGGPVKLRALTRKDVASYQYDAFITAGTVISARWDILGDVYAGGDVAELGLATNRGDVVFSFKNGYGNLGNGSGGLLKLGGNSEVSFDHLYDTGGAGSGSSVTRTGGGTNYAYVIGGVIHPWASHSGSFIRAHSPGDDTQIYFKGTTIIGPASNDPILATNLHPMILENSSIVLGSGATNWVRGQVPSTVQIRGGLGLNTYKPHSANITLSGVSYSSDIRAPIATIGDLSVSGGANVVGDLTAGTFSTTGNGGIGNYLNLGTLADQILMADHEGYVTNVTLGSGLSLAGTTLSATGGAGSSNYTTLASGSLTVGTVIASNLVRAGQVDVLTNLNAATVVVTNSVTTPLANVGQIDVRTNLYVATVTVTNSITTPLANVGQIDVRTNAYVGALRVTNGLTHSSWMSGAGNYTNTGNIRSSGGTVSSFNGSDYVALDASVSALRTSFDPLTIAWQNTAIADLRTNMSLIYSNLGIQGTNFVGTLALPNVATNKLLMTGGGSNVVAATVGPGLTFNSGVIAADGVLTNLVGTAARNVTNFVSLSTTNATSKPLTNSYTAGVLTMFGLEQGANITLTPNASNIVIAAAAASANLFSAGNTNATDLSIVHQGTNSTGGIKTIRAGSNITITESGATNLVIASSGGSNPEVATNFFKRASFDHGVESHWVRVENQVATPSLGGFVGNGTSSPIVASSTAPYHVRYTSSATSNSFAGWADLSSIYASTRNFMFACRLAVTVTNGTQMTFVGLTPYTGIPSVHNPADVICFRYAPILGGDTTWTAYSANSGTGSQVTNINTGITVTNEAWYTLGFTKTASSITWYINGTSVATNNDTTSFPAGDTSGLVAGTKTMTNQVTAVRLHKWFFEQPLAD